MKRIIWVFLMLMIPVFSSAAFAEMPEALKGTWVVDAKATEAFLKRFPPANAEQWLPKTTSDMFQRIYDFDGEVIAASTYAGDRKLIYRPLSQESGNKRYISEEGGRDDILIVSIVNEKNITISSSRNQFMGAFFWKRIKLDPGARENDGKLATEESKSAIQDFMRILNVTPGAAVNTGAAQ